MSSGFDFQRWNELEFRKQKLEIEALNLYRPSPLQLPFHVDKTKEAIVRGGKRAGKSLAAAMEFASRVLGIPIKDRDGNEIPNKFDVSTPGSPLQYWIIGWDTKHAETIHRLLFQPGMGGTLKAIKDEETGEWRNWNQAYPSDVKRRDEAVLTEPIIPPRFWLGGSEDEAFSWEEKKTNRFYSCKLENGAIIYFYPSSAKNPKQGEAVAGIWIDEDIQFPAHLKEWQDRLADMRGWFTWSAWPHTKNNALLGLLDRASRQEKDENPQIKSYQLVMTQNPFITAEGKAEALDRMESEEEIARRDRGDVNQDELNMYSYEPRWHLIRMLEQGETDDNMHPRGRIRQLITAAGKLPRDWTRYLSIDPSHTRTACLSFAVPPKKWEGVYFGDLAVVEWELVVKRYNAKQLAKELRGLMSGVYYEAFIMDQQIGRQTNTGRDDTVFDLYADAFREEGLLSRQTHNHFIPGCNEPPTRQRAVREMLELGDEGMPMLMFIENKTWMTQKEFWTYRKKTEDKDGNQHIYDQPANPRVHDCMAALEYGSAYLMQLFQMEMAYQDPEIYGDRVSPALRKARELIKKDREDQPEYVHLGPGDIA